MGCSQNGYERVNQYALVSYIPDPIGKFLDLLRLQLVPACRPHAHVTVLPPRPLNAPVERAEAELRQKATQFQPFEVKLGSVEIFDRSEVIYIEVECGESELRHMHKELNHGAVKFDEPFEFHPHITLAQSLPHEQVPQILDRARRFWSEWKGKTTFQVDELCFVQNTVENVWLDLMHLRLDHQPVVSVR
jgi:2'-5' RNA ligase